MVLAQNEKGASRVGDETALSYLVTMLGGRLVWVGLFALLVACGGQSQGRDEAPDASSGGSGGLVDALGGRSGHTATAGMPESSAGNSSAAGMVGIGAGGESAGAAGEPSSAIEDLGHTLAETQCSYEERCASHPMYSRFSGGCMGVLGPKLENTVEVQVRAGVAVGTIHYDANELAKCLERWASEDCASGAPADLECLAGRIEGREPRSRCDASLFECPGGLDGTVELGRRCKIDLECAGDAFCYKQEEGCYGVCTPRGREGDKCDQWDEPCTPGTACPFQSENPSVVPYVCTRLRAEGETGCEGIGCTGSLECRLDGTSEHGRCVRPEVVALGDGCADPSYFCPPGSACVIHHVDFVRSDYCAPLSASGGACLRGFAASDPGSCPTGEACRNVSVGEEVHTACVRSLKLGEACAFQVPCEAPLVCSDSRVCELPFSRVNQCNTPGGRPPGDADPMSNPGALPAGSLLDTFGWRVADARCRRDASCWLTPSYPSAYGGCVGIQGPQLENTLGDQVRSGVAAGRITLDPEVMATCLANLATLDCAKSTPSTTKGDLECPGGLEGTVPLGSPCASSLECAGDARCSANDCTGICVAVVRAAEGESCDTNACTLDTFCQNQPVGESIGPGVCRRHKAEGERGCRGVGCEGRLFCLVEEQAGMQDDGICVRRVLRQVGEACGNGDVCAPDSRCQSGRCVAATADGEHCEDWNECVAVDYCEPTDQRCLRFSRLGEGCDSIYHCQQGLSCVEARCALPLDNGEECQSGDQCVTGRCLDGHCLDPRSCYPQ